MKQVADQANKPLYYGNFCNFFEINSCSIGIPNNYVTQQKC